MERKRAGKAGDLVWALVLIICVLAGLALIYHGADLHYPLGYYGDDGMGVFYVVKSIRDHGVSLVNPELGGMTGADMYDYPYGCLLPFLLVKGISFFVSDVYMITNLFYFLCYILSALSAFCVCRLLKLSPGSSWTAALLFAFSPFIQMRYTHMWLVPYFMMPFACLIAVWIINDEIRAAGAGGKASLLHSRRFFMCLLLAFFISWTGVYYAFFACALFALAMVVRMVRTRRIFINLYPLSFVIAAAAGVLVNIFPTILYTLKNGANPMSETATRGAFESELYGLKLAQLLLPRNGHRISYLAELKNYYNANSYFFNESTTATLGLVSALAFVAAILLLMRGLTAGTQAAVQAAAAQSGSAADLQPISGSESGSAVFQPAELPESWKIYSSVPALILGSYLIASVGGVSSLLSVLVSTPVRGYNRMSTTIMFLCLLITAQWLDDVRRKKAFRGAAGILLCLLITAAGIFDQTVNCGASDTSEIDNARNFVSRIEDQMEDGAWIFEYPYVDWPSGGCYRLFFGYLESSDLRWSFGCMQGRGEAQWQSETASLPAGKMIKKLKKAGYSGLYLDAVSCRTILQAGGMNEEAARAETLKRIGEFSRKLGEPMVSEDGELYFWSLNADVPDDGTGNEGAGQTVETEELPQEAAVQTVETEELPQQLIMPAVTDRQESA